MMVRHSCAAYGDKACENSRRKGWGLAFFSEGGPAARALPSSSSREPARKRQWGRADQRPEMCKFTPAQPPRASPSPTSKQSPILFSRPELHPSPEASDRVSFGGSEEEPLDDSMSLAASETEGWAGDTEDPAHLPTLEPIDCKPGMDAELFRFFLKAVEELSHCGAGLMSGSCRVVARPLANATPHLSQSSEEKGYKHLPPLDKAVAAHLCPPAAVGWKTKRALLSKPCKTTSALAGRAYTRPRAKLPQRCTPWQSSRCFMASLVVLKHHLWLILAEIKELDKTVFLDATVSPSGLFGPAVEGFTECFTAAQKSSQAMQHFLPKRSSSASASSRPRSAPAQQNKPAPSASQAAAPKDQRQRSLPTKCSSSLDPAPAKSS
ncbi:hypothetical protein DPX16_3434 [Anabarilius grahami]|uniref:Uncharacterized protein n=1 Tax=Anabarilius grahami TaxID=495550 RepID=A0A3N0Z686_ANAGA|nr:hypothetical protein DPX16_3434 [Anabarilius grahami]